MVRTFFVGVILGIGATIAALYYLPVVDQKREISIVSVNPNGGNSEVFHINIPMDRIMSGPPGEHVSVPQGLAWPEVDVMSGVQAEVFKIRNSRDSVIGLASRIAASNESNQGSIEWVLHFPARGSIFVEMQPETVGGMYRIGNLHSGTREFETLVGQLSERWVADPNEKEGAPAGRIELATGFVSTEFGDDDETGTAEVEASRGGK